MTLSSLYTLLRGYLVWGNGMVFLASFHSFAWYIFSLGITIPFHPFDQGMAIPLHLILFSSLEKYYILFKFNITEFYNF